MRKRHQEGIALITSLLILLLVSTMMVGLAWLVMGDQKLGGNNRDRQLGFYAAEAGMEQLTASLENAFGANYALNKTAIDGLMTNPGPPQIQGVQYIAPGSTTDGSGYQIEFAPNPSNPNLPASSFSNIPTGPYAGLVGLMTPYTLTVTAQTAYGSEVRLQRVVQTVGIPVFQFGFFSQMDLSFFAGPNFNFGGRVHTNGNLWLAENTGNTLTLSQKVTAAGEIITANLENGVQTSSSGRMGAINITTGSGMANLKSQSPSQSVTGTANYYQNIGSYASGFASMASGVYKNNIGVKETGIKPLDVSIATPSIGGQSIDLIRRPVFNEDTGNPAKLAERYYSQTSLRVLLSDYGPSGTCADSDISSASANALPDLAPNLAAPTTTPIDLATLAWDSTYVGATNPPYSTAPGWLSGIGTNVFPLPVSNATAAYSATNGYWVQQHFPIITGCIKIDYQDKNNPGTWNDVTPEILLFGYTGRNINPQSSSTASDRLPPLPGAQVAASACSDPSNLAVIRLARVRDNPSFWANTNAAARCGVWPTTTANQHGTDYWPNVLYDTREGVLQDSALTAAGQPGATLAGAMHYVELDVANLAKWFTGLIGTNGANVLAVNGYSVYFSDRRGNLRDPAPPASVSATSALTGAFGYEEFVNNYGCPNNTLDQGEDVESDYINGSSQSPTTLRTYGNILNPASAPLGLWPVNVAGVYHTQLGTLATLEASALRNNSSCAGPGTTWPFAAATDRRDLRENPPIFFRRALKLVNGGTISLGTCNSVPCGLTVVAENPVYVQGCYNNPGCTYPFSASSVGSSVIADAVTLLSGRWNDVNSFAFPYTTGSRAGITTTYRLAIAAGKGVPFKRPTSGTPPEDFGTDGGAHNFLRYLENWGGQTLYYDGSIVSMWYNHQAVGVYKCCATVYSPPTRGYQFDTNFLTPSLLPPLTPMLRTINTIGFTQMLLPTQ